MKMKISLLPHYDRRNAWLEILPPLSEAAVLTGDLLADHVVVGGGFGGLAAAEGWPSSTPMPRSCSSRPTGSATTPPAGAAAS